MTEYSTQAAERVKESLDKLEWQYEWLEERGIFKFVMGMRSKIKDVEMVIHVKKASLLVLGSSPLRVDKRNLGRVGEYITRANYGLVHGNFEMDLSDGEVRYRSSIPFGADIPLIAVGFIVTLPLKMWEKYGDGFVAMLFSDASPEEEIRKAESDG